MSENNSKPLHNQPTDPSIGQGPGSYELPDDFLSVAIDFEQIEEISRVFFAESHEILESMDPLILALEHDPSDMGVLNTLFRKVHTLKGSAGSVPGGQLLGSLAHEFEALLSKIKREKKAATKDCIDLFLNSTRLLKLLAQTLRDQVEILPEVLSEVIDLINHFGHVDLGNESTAAETAHRKAPKALTVGSSQDGVWMDQKQLNEMMKISGEILALKNHFQMMIETEDFKTKQLEFNQSLTKISDQFQSQLSKVMKVKAEECLKGLSTLVRQVSTELNKEVQLTSCGLDLSIDKNMGRDINEVLIHLIRNSVDHGLEDPFDRITEGKPPAGQLSLGLSEKNDFVIVDFKDDGKGLDRNRILVKAIEKDLTPALGAENLTDTQIFDFIFHPGFSTKEKISTISGRGVGMDVVGSIVQKYKGRIEIKSGPAIGTHFQMWFAVPQHMMMETVILCSWHEMQIAVPVEQLLQIQSASELQITELQNIRYAQWNGRTVPTLNYSEFVSRKILQSVENQSVLFLCHQDQIVGLIVDRIEHQADLMVRPFGRLLKAMPGFRGTAVLADDRVTYILETEHLIEVLRNSASITMEMNVTLPSRPIDSVKKRSVVA